ncbi:hypothetical protein [Amycolatopsis lexingtonensis]|uniref:hypothetical protein n=1 Tax=Amycolatopsis lexingtonensis TaxID=218822 RepID=UPI003F71A7F4
MPLNEDRAEPAWRRLAGVVVHRNRWFEAPAQRRRLDVPDPGGADLRVVRPPFGELLDLMRAAGSGGRWETATRWAATCQAEWNIARGEVSVMVSAAGFGEELGGMPGGRGTFRWLG